MTGHGRPQEDRSRRRRWAALLLALVAVAGLAAMQAEAQSKVPRIQRVSFANSPERGDTFELGEKIEVTVRFDRTVELSNTTLKLALAVGGSTRYAESYSITDEQALNFYYRIGADDHDADGISILADSLSLNDGAIKLAGDAETDAVLTHAAVDDRYAKVIGARTKLEVVRQTISEAWKQLTDGILDRIAPYRSTRSYPAETPCPRES